MQTFKLAEIFCDGMILQRNMEIKIFGEALEKCIITAEINNQKTSKEVEKGFFIITLPPQKEGENLTLTVSSGEQREIIKNVYCGEVFIAGGQSNMAMSLNGTADYMAGEPIVENEKIRFYTVARNSVFTIDECGEEYSWAFNESTKWSGCTNKSAANFSAAAYYFAQKLQKKLNIPIGIINCNVGGSNIFGWMPEDAILGNEDIKDILISYQNDLKNMDLAESLNKFKKYLDDIKPGWGDLKANNEECPYFYYEEYGPFSYHRPCCLYYTMLVKAIYFAVRGMIWYQGESESFAEQSYLYNSAQRSLVKNFKKVSGNPDFEFFFVQIAPYDDPNIRDWEGICNAQREYYLENPQNAMVTIGDCSGHTDIHPPIKKPVGIRLANAALSKIYNMPEEYCGPCAVSAVYKDNLIEIDFIHNDKMYTSENIGEFEVVDANGNVEKCKGYLKNNKVYVEYNKSVAPKYVRYEWRTYYQVGLFNSVNLPASIFNLGVIVNE